MGLPPKGVGAPNAGKLAARSSWGHLVEQDDRCGDIQKRRRAAHLDGGLRASSGPGPAWQLASAASESHHRTQNRSLVLRRVAWLTRARGPTTLETLGGPRQRRRRRSDRPWRPAVRGPQARLSRVDVDRAGRPMCGESKDGRRRSTLVDSRHPHPRHLGYRRSRHCSSRQPTQCLR